MGQQEMEQLADRLTQDASFRDQFRQDPVGAAQGAGIQLSDDDVAHLNAANYADLSDKDVVKHLVGHDMSP
ncbi:MAG: NHLP-related RiPP peptide [Solirubrobacteraceae bacterium]